MCRSSLRLSGGSAALALLLLAACRTEPEPAPPSDVKPGVALAAATAGVPGASLSGRWVVREGGRVVWTFDFGGGAAEAAAVEAIDQRFSAPRSVKGELIVQSATRFGIKGGDGVTYSYAYARVGDALYLGLGDVWEIDSLDAFSLPLGPFTRLDKGERACVLVNTREGGKRKVRCGFEGDDTRGALRVFWFERPDRFSPGEMERRRLLVVGERHLMSEEIGARPAERVDAD